MRKQTKLVAVLSAAALLAMGASMTSFAAGWEKDDSGIWHYYDSDDEMVTGEWKKDGGKWFYLDDDGEMLTDSWVDDEYYVGNDGAMLVNSWIKTTSDEDIDDPDEDGDHWYYFGSKGKKTTESKKIAGKTYYFNEDGEMQDGWYEDDGDVYYLGGEDEGWRKESGWLWLEKPDDDDDITGCDDECSICDEEGWYYFGSNGKMYKDYKKKKDNGKYYYFNEHGQMLYEWINDAKVKVKGSPSNAEADGNVATPNKAEIENMLYMNQVEEGWRADGWYEIDGAEDVGTDNDTDWYYFDDGEAKRADSDKDFAQIEDNDETPIWRAKIKIKASNNKYFCFDEVGRMQTGLQYIPAAKGFYYFDDNGYMKTGKVNNVEDDDDSYTFYFNTKNGKNGEGVNGEKDNYLYFSGKRLEADDDYRLYLSEGKVYLVNNKGKIQKSKTKKYDIENFDEEVTVAFGNGDSVKSLTVGDKTYTLPVVIENVKDIATMDSKVAKAITVPEIKLYDNTYSYGVVTNGDIVRTWVAEADTDALSLN